MRLLDEELVVIAPLDHPLTRFKRVRVERLAGEALVTYAAGSALRDTLFALVPGGRVVAEANDLETVRELTARGLGVTVMPRSVAVWHRDGLAITAGAARSWRLARSSTTRQVSVNVCFHQSEHVQGLGGVIEALLADDHSSVVELLEDGRRLGDRERAPPGVPRHLDDDQIPLAEVDQLLGHDPIRVPGAAPLGFKLAVALVSPGGSCNSSVPSSP